MKIIIVIDFTLQINSIFFILIIFISNLIILMYIIILNSFDSSSHSF
jgi:hypothetical protein